METSTVEIRIGDTEDTIELPSEVFAYVAEDGEDPATTVADLLMIDWTHRLHAATHHGSDEADEELLTLEEEMRDLFEDRFGMTFAELTGHSH